MLLRLTFERRAGEPFHLQRGQPDPELHGAFLGE